MEKSAPTPVNASDFLHPPSSSIFARRTSVSAESIALDGSNDEPLPVYPKTDEQIRRIKAATKTHFLFRDLDEEQESGVLNAMQERRVVANEVVIRQGDVGEYFYVVESGFLNVYIRPEPLPPNWLQLPNIGPNNVEEKFVQSKFHPEFGRMVQECKAGSCFGELALMYGHPRAASVVAMEPSTLWSLDRITFRTIILKAAYRKRTMYEHFLSTVNLLSSLDPPERSKIADALVSSVYVDGEAVVRQGEMGDTFFFIEEGEAIVTKRQQNENGEPREIKVGHLKKGDYFGGE
jgi:cAMP-dependent protein kinase regulator